MSREVSVSLLCASALVTLEYHVENVMRLGYMCCVLVDHVYVWIKLPVHVVRTRELSTFLSS